MAEVNGVEDFVRIRKDFVDEGAGWYSAVVCRN